MAIEAFTDGGNTLGAQMVRHGFLGGDTAGRRWALHISHRIGAKAVAWDAAEDARLNALIFQRVIEEHGSIEAAIATLGLHVKPHIKAPSQGGQR